jgi:hypothetical protein
MAKKRKSPKGLTPRERKILKARIAGKSMRVIGKEIGTSKSRVFQILQRLEPELKRALRRATYGLDKAVTKMVEMTQAKETKFFANQGLVMDQRKVEDNQTRFEARKTMLQLHGVLGSKVQVSGENGGPVEVVIRNAIERPQRGKP